MKKIIFAVLFIFLSVTSVSSKETTDMEKIYKEQFKASKADTLQEQLPQETKNTLDNLDIDGVDVKKITGLTPEKIFGKIFSIAKEKSNFPLKIVVEVLAVILLCALVESMKLSLGDKPLSGIIGVIGTLCICICVVSPIILCINHTCSVIKGAANFMICYVPVMTGIMIATGQSVSAGSYHFLMLAAGEVISLLSSKFLVPMLNIFLSLSIVSSISPRLNLKGICESFNKIIKWVLGFVMSVFVSLLTLENIVGTAIDTTGTKTLKFAINSFIPIVGGALSDAFTTIQGCVKLLKSGVGAFGIIAIAFIFIPIIIECLIWMGCLSIASSAGEIFDLKQISNLLKSCTKVISTLMVIIICCMVILIISTVLMLIIGGNT